jgi:hypothetical protein
MIATARFVHIHLHKSGGTFVNECLLRFFPEAQRLGYHLPRSLIPVEWASLPVLGFVRNPWSYYVSWYAFQSRRPQPNALFRVLSEDGSLDFKATLRNMLSLGEQGGKLDELLPRLPAAYGTHGLNLPAFALAPIRDSGLGFYSYLFRYMYAGDPERLHVGRTETLRADLPAFFERIGVAPSQPLLDFIRHQPPLNASRHEAFASYYDRDARELVRARDGALIERFGFRFDG